MKICLFLKVKKFSIKLEIMFFDKFIEHLRSETNKKFNLHQPHKNGFLHDQSHKSPVVVWVGVKADLRIAYSNQKSSLLTNS